MRHLLATAALSLLSLPLAPLLAACGDAPRPAARPAASSGDAGAKTPGLVLSPPPSGLPPLSPMPPPGVIGSKKGRPKNDPALFACGGGALNRAKDPEGLVKRLGEACATTAKMKPSGAMLKGQQADTGRADEQKLKAEAGKCYRIVFATDENVKDAVVALRDSAGDMIAESPGAALPVDGAICFETSDDVTLLVGVGAGKGTWAAQVWSN